MGEGTLKWYGTTDNEEEITMESWNSLAEKAKADGFSVQLMSGDIPTGGYMVALAGHEEMWPVELFAADALVGYVSRKFDILTGEGDVYLGAWMADGVVYLDVSECITDRALALDVGAQRSQLAVWDVANGVEVTCSVPA